MTTLKITIDSRKNAQLLTKLLKSMAFVKKVEEDTPIRQKTDQFSMLKKIFDSIDPNSIFRSIDSPAD
jgi:hypothetical protein